MDGSEPDRRGGSLTADEFRAMSADEILEHYGVKGMRWGVRRSEEQLARARREKAVKKEVKDYLRSEKIMKKRGYGPVLYELGAGEASQRIARSRRENPDSRRKANKQAKKGELNDEDRRIGEKRRDEMNRVVAARQKKIQDYIDNEMPKEQKAAVRERIDKKGIKKLSDQDLQERITRLEKERKLGDLQKSEGEKMAEDIIKGIGTKTLKTVGTGVAIYGGKLVVNAVLGEKAASFVPKPKK